MTTLQDRVAIITGAASPDGLGFATAKLFAEQGAAVILTDLSPDIQKRIGDLPSGANALALQHDVRDETAWDAIFSSALEKFGRVDILVNNAGITLRDPIDIMTFDTWRAVIDTNLNSSFLGCRAAVREMRRHGGGGAIVNIASISGVVGMRNSSPYGASKGGIRSLTKVVALETAREGIRCNVICPGLIMSDIHTAVIEKTPDAHKSLVDAIPMGRLGEPKDIADAALFLASDAARYVTGTELIVDGGYTAE
jgi:NAD(P)-dependent dehydrogenase (short-subunit alcohol dehydrogenase family)